MRALARHISITDVSVTVVLHQSESYMWRTKASSDIRLLRIAPQKRINPSVLTITEQSGRWRLKIRAQVPSLEV